MKLKRDPTLADRVAVFLDVPSFIPAMRKLKNDLLEAKRFVLDAHATSYVRSILEQGGDAIAYGSEFAIPPFKNMWIEFGWQGEEDDVAGYYGRMGYLIRDNTVTHVSWITGRDFVGQEPLIIPFVINLHKPFTPESRQAFLAKIGASEEILDQFFGGSIGNHEYDISLGRALKEVHSCDMLFGPDVQDLQDPTAKQAAIDEYQRRVKAGSGTLPYVIALLLLLNQTADTQTVTEVGPSRRMIGNKAATLMRHSTISINLSPVKKIIRLGKRAGIAWRRQHDVRGYFSRNKLARLAEQSFGVCKDMSHDWNKVREHRWECGKCGGIKWWKDTHKRGRLETGVVESSYAVTAETPYPN